jgi:hypothetical protein
MITRADAIAGLGRLAAHDFFRGVCLGGADATGRADELSDVDVLALVSPGSLEAAASALEAAVRAVSPIAIASRLPMPTWHGFPQAFYQLAAAPEHLMIDCVFLEAGAAHPWFEVERHGTARVLFDKDGLVAPVHVDRAALSRVIAKRVAEIRTRFALFRHLGPKCAARGLPVDACSFYHALALRPLVDMLRITHCPDRHDLGPRYLRDDLPSREYEMVRRLGFARDAEDVGAFVREIEGEVAELLARWDSRHGD